MTRLSAVTAPETVRPSSRGIVHLGLGAFHRAHQAAYTHEVAVLTGDTSWGITGVTQRSTAVADQLLPQDCLFTLVQKSAEGSRSSVIGSITEVLNAVTDSSAVVDAIADPGVRIVTLTVTEKGYRLDPSTGRLRLDDPEIAADLTGRTPRTVVGQLVAGLVRRAGSDSPLTVLCCDNLPHNGIVLEGLVSDFVARAVTNTAVSEDLALWISRRVSFPSTMVDRIVPATTDEDRDRSEAESGLRDDALVVCEPFRHWVIEDRFVTDRPAWELVGVQFVDDVQPWEQMKLRVLNATHSLLAYLGARSGHTTIAEAVSDPELRSVARRMIVENVAPTLPVGMDPVACGEQVLARFANPALPHTTRQVAMDGSQKLGPRLLGTARDAVAAGTPVTWLAFAVAAWIRFVVDEVEAGRTLDDPMADTLKSAASEKNPVRALMSTEQIFGTDLGADSDFGVVVSTIADLLNTGTTSEAEKELS